MKNGIHGALFLSGLRRTRQLIRLKDAGTADMDTNRYRRVAGGDAGDGLTGTEVCVVCNGEGGVLAAEDMADWNSARDSALPRPVRQIVLSENHIKCAQKDASGFC